MDFPIQIDRRSSRDCPLCTLRGQRYKFLIYNIYDPEGLLILEYSADPDEMQHYRPR